LSCIYSRPWRRLYCLSSDWDITIIGLGYYYIGGKDSEERKTRIIEQYPGGIEGRNAPFPLFVVLILVGTIGWSLAYIILIGVLGVRI
jgi:hypothetical protein